MKVFSSNTGGDWLTADPFPVAPEGAAAPDAAPSPGESEAKRALSDLFRCNNLVVLAGLGTSLCVEPAQVGGSRAPTMGDLWREVARVHSEKMAEGHFTRDWNGLLGLVGHPTERLDIEALLSRCRLGEAFLGGDDLVQIQRLIALAETVIADKVNFLVHDHSLPLHVEFLRRAARRSNRKSRTKIFTTNYDRCFEEAGRQGRYVVVDGFSHTAPPTFDAVHFTYDIVRRSRESDAHDFISNVFHLYKLHGSIDWERAESGEVHKNAATRRPLLIYPRNSKYELAFEQPYLETISAFQAAIREPNTGLLVVGFGFNDNHLAEPIMSAVRSNLGLKVGVVGPFLAPHEWQDEQKPGEAATNAHIRKLRDLAGAGDARISLVNCGFEGMVDLVPDLAAESDLEQHFERLRRLGG